MRGLAGLKLFCAWFVDDLWVFWVVFGWLVGGFKFYS